MLFRLIFDCILIIFANNKNKLTMKDFSKLFSSQDPNEMSASMFKEMARENIKDFLEFFRKDYYAKIDFDQKCELLDEAMPYFLPPQYTSRKDAFNLFVKAHLKKKGRLLFLDSCHFCDGKWGN